MSGSNAMMNYLKILKSGAGNSIQDSGRFGYRKFGVPVSGVADYYYAKCANALVGNELDEPLIEIPIMGPTLQVHCSNRSFALVGEIRIKKISKNRKIEIQDPWKAFIVEPDDIIELSGTKGTAYLAVQGGIKIKPIMKSYSTYQRAKLGGLNGTWLEDNDVIPLHPTDGPKGFFSEQSFNHEPGPFRIIPGPQEFLFQQESLYQFVTTKYTVSNQWDRMGIRLEGQLLKHLSPKHTDIPSDGITPGAIQVPGSGAPIILGIDSQTIGGYPKIATVMTADVSRLAHLRTGDQIEFKNIKIDDAVMLLKQKNLRLDRWIQALQTTDCTREFSNPNQVHRSA